MNQRDHVISRRVEPVAIVLENCEITTIFKHRLQTIINPPIMATVNVNTIYWCKALWVIVRVS